MEITLEQIDIVRQRTGVGYKEAREALETVGGNLVDALVLLEKGQFPNNSPTMMTFTDQPVQENEEQNSLHMDESPSVNGKSNGHSMVSKVVEYGKNTKIKVTLPGGRKVEIPVVVGAAGAVFAPKMAVLSGLALLMAKSSLSIDYNAKNDSGDDAERH